jgi:hypothetical protein
LVQNNGTTYRYVVSTGKKGIIENDSTLDKKMPKAANKFPAAEPVSLKPRRHWTTVNKKNSGKPKPVQNEIPEPAIHHPKSNIIQQNWVVAEEAPEYVIHTGAIEFVTPQPDTEMLKKVRL